MTRQDRAIVVGAVAATLAAAIHGGNLIADLIRGDWSTWSLQVQVVALYGAIGYPMHRSWQQIARERRASHEARKEEAAQHPPHAADRP